METLIVHPKDAAQQKVAQAFLSALDIPFEISAAAPENPYNAEFNAKMARAEADIKAGRVKTMNPDDLWK